MNDSEALRAANEELYRAFESLDRTRMERVWLRSARTQCTHPGWQRLVGFPAVIASWERIFESTLEVSFDLTGVEISVKGDLAWVVCTENLTTRTTNGPTLARIEATNLFERHQGRWLLVHHHGSPVVSRAEPDEPAPHLH